MEEVVYCTDIYGHDTGNNKWLVYWALVDREIDRFKGKRIVYKYNVRCFRVLCDNKPDMDIHRRLFLANQEGRELTGDWRTVYTNQDPAISKAKAYLHDRTKIVANGRNSELLFTPHELYSVYNDIKKLTNSEDADNLS
jgi:hypothetical protein